MRRLDRYVVSHVAIALLGVTTVMLALAFALEWIDQRSSTLGIGDALILAALTMPRRLTELLPFAALFGVLAGLGALAATEELTAARAAGVSIRRLVGAALVPVCVLLAMGIACGETLMPAAEAQVALLKAERRGGDAHAPLRWARFGEHWVAAAAVGRDGSLHGVTAFEFRAATLDAAWHARSLTNSARGAHARDLDGTWLDESRVRVARAPARAMPMHVDVQAFSAFAARDASRIGLGELQARITQLQASSGVAAGRVRAHYDNVRWQRLGQPPAVLLLAVLGAGFVFGSLRRTRIGVRVAAGLLLAIAFKYLCDLLAALVLLYMLPAWWSAAAPLLLLGMAAAFVLRRAA